MAAKKGNQYALGNSGGRPRLWNSPGELEIYIDDYFEEMDRRKVKVYAKQLDKEGKPVILNVQRPYTVEGLCLHIGCGRRTLTDYETKEGFEEFTPVIMRAKQKIVEQRVTYGLVGAFDANFARFTLMNMTDMREKGQSENTNYNHPIEPLTAGEARKIAKQLEDEV